MPLRPSLKYINKGLLVAYRGSSESQHVDVRLKLSRPTPFARKGMVPSRVDAFMRDVNSGACGGSSFAPEAGHAELVKGSISMTDELSVGPIFAWTLLLRGVSPRAWRVFLDHPSEDFVRCEIVGELPVDDTPLSTNESRMREWLNDPQAYPERWTALDYPFELRDLPRGSRIAVTVGKPVDEGLEQSFRNCVSAWGRSTANYYSERGELSPAGTTVRPNYSSTKRTLVAVGDRFDQVREPSAAILANMLQVFHKRVCPIEKAVVELS